MSRRRSTTSDNLGDDDSAAGLQLGDRNAARASLEAFKEGAVQVVAGPTFAPRCKISMEGLQGLRTGDTCRLTLKAADQYGNLRLDGDDAVQLALEGPGGFAARAVSVVELSPAALDSVRARLSEAVGQASVHTAD